MACDQRGQFPGNKEALVSPVPVGELIGGHVACNLGCLGNGEPRQADADKDVDDLKREHPCQHAGAGAVRVYVALNLDGADGG